MQPQRPNIGAAIASFIGLGIFIVLLIVSIFIFSYLFIMGAAIGLILFTIAAIRNWWWRRKHKVSIKHDARYSGRVIDQNDKLD
jgi:hypothetical protein